MTNFTNGQRVTIAPGATWGTGSNVNYWLLDHDAEVYIDSARVDNDGDVHVRVEGKGGGYVNADFVTPYQPFKSGDRVRAVREAVSWKNYNRAVQEGETFVIDFIDKWGASKAGYTLVFTDHRDGGIFKAEDFELVTETETYTFDPGGEKIEFGDVQVGDTIAALTYEQWRVAEVTGKNGHVLRGPGAHLAYRERDTKEIRLLHRPEPEVDATLHKAVCDAIEGVDFDTDIEGIATALIKAGVTVNA